MTYVLNGIVDVIRSENDVDSISEKVSKGNTNYYIRQWL